MRNNKGQNLVEYILLVTAVVVVSIYFCLPGGIMTRSVNGSLNSILNEINHANSEIQLN